jgi:glycosyltransferase involved in cell wall biosynthesis
MAVPSISVCMAVYNGESTIGSVLDSVLAQSVPIHEIIVVDDGSSDRSAEIATSKGARVVSVANAGLGAARKRLVEEATGDLVAFIDHDDDWVPKKLERQISAFDDPAVVLAHSDAWYVYEDGREVSRVLHIPHDKRSFDHILPSNLVVASSAVFRRDAMLAAGNFITETIRCSDWYGWLILAPHGKFAHIPEKHVRYRVLSSSLANAGFRFQEAKRFLLKEIIMPRQAELFSGLPDREARRYLRMVEVNIGIAASTMAKYLDKEGKASESVALHAEAMRLAKSVPRVWSRSLRSKLGIR